MVISTKLSLAAVGAVNVALLTGTSRKIATIFFAMRWGHMLYTVSRNIIILVKERVSLCASQPSRRVLGPTRDRSHKSSFVATWLDLFSFRHPVLASGMLIVD